MDEAKSGVSEYPKFAGLLAPEKALLSSAKKIALFCFGLATQRFGNSLADQQEVAGAIAEILAEVLLLESAILRTEKLGGGKALAAKLTTYYAAGSFRLVRAAAEVVVSTVVEGDTVNTQMKFLRKLCDHTPVNTVTIGREISNAMVEAGQYKF